MRAFALLPLMAGLCGCASVSTYPNTSVYRDTQGVAWLQPLPDSYKNGCFTSGGRFDRDLCAKSIEATSPAAFACEKIGARLPTADNVRGLIRDFESTATKDDVRLTENGLRELRQTFGHNETAEWYWTATVSEKDPEKAYLFSLREGGLSSRVESRYVALPVRCVR